MFDNTTIADQIRTFGSSDYSYPTDGLPGFVYANLPTPCNDCVFKEQLSCTIHIFSIVSLSQQGDLINFNYDMKEYFMALLGTKICH